MTNFAKIVIIDLKTGEVIKEFPVMSKKMVIEELILIIIAIIDSKKDFESPATIKIVEVKDEEFDEEKLNTYIDKRIEEFSLS